MKKMFMILLIGILIVGGLYFYNKNKDIEEDLQIDDQQLNEEPLNKQDLFIEVGKEAPDFTLENLEGEKITLSELRGKNVMINFWATWCPYCVKEMPDLNKLYIENKDFVVLAIDVSEKKEDIEKYLKDKSYKFPILMDKDAKVSMEYMIRGIPTTYMIDKEGKVRVIKMSMMKYPEMKRMLESVEE